MKRVLIVDDSNTLRRMVRACLEGLEGVEFAEAATGLEALEQIALHPPHLLILDINMPDMHGFDVLRFLRSHENLRHLPVIILTTRGDDMTRQEAQQAGADVYMTKPFQPEELRQQVKQLLERTEASLDHE